MVLVNKQFIQVIRLLIMVPSRASTNVVGGIGQEYFLIESCRGFKKLVKNMSFPSQKMLCGFSFLENGVLNQFWF